MLSRAFKDVFFVLLIISFVSIAIKADILEDQNNRSLSNLRKQFVKLYLKAEKGNAYAQYAVGMMYYSRKGTPQNTESAVVWFTKAAEQNYPDAQYFLSLLYSLGDGVAQNDQTAAQWC